MEVLKNINTVVSTCAGILSIVMFFLARNEKNKCIEIKNQIEQNINVSRKDSSIKSKDRFSIEKVERFDNRKSIN